MLSTNLSYTEFSPSTIPRVSKSQNACSFFSKSASQCDTELMDVSTYKTCEQVRHAIDGSRLSPGTGAERTHPNFVSIAVGPVLPRRIPPVATFQYWSTPIKILISSASLESHESARSSPCRYGNRSTAQLIGCPDRGSQISWEQ